MPPTNTRTQRSSLIKSARDIMRKDAGLNGDPDRLQAQVSPPQAPESLLPSVLDRAFKGTL